MRPSAIATAPRCERCDAPIFWARWTSRTHTPGRPVPLNVGPVEGGNVKIRRYSDDDVEAQYCAPSSRAAYVAHFATCPDAKAWRRFRPPAAPPIDDGSEQLALVI